MTYIVKTDGVTSGKGVLVTESLDEMLAAIACYFTDSFGDRLIVERSTQPLPPALPDAERDDR